MASSTLSAWVKLKALWLSRGAASLRQQLDNELLAAAKKSSTGALASVSNNGSSAAFHTGGTASVDAIMASAKQLDDLYHEALAVLGPSATDEQIYDVMLQWLEPVRSFRIDHTTSNLP